MRAFSAIETAGGDPSAPSGLARRFSLLRLPRRRTAPPPGGIRPTAAAARAPVPPPRAAAGLYRTGRPPRSAIISPFHEASKANKIMEAERLNAIESSLADLRRRAGELRGYL
nr:peptide chain release factor 2 domain protein [Burkholderia pseudomallei]